MAKAQELKDLDVDRVDGVDKPATGRNFLLFKSEDAGAVMKSFGALATVAHEVLAKVRTDKNLVASRKSAIALNGLAQVLGEDAVFVGKSVPTQPYMFTEPDADKRGPADEGLGPNFTPRSMPGSMVGSVQFRLKDEEEEGRKVKAAYDEEEEEDESEEDRKKKTKKKPMMDEMDDDDEMDASERANRGVARSIAEMAKAIAGQTEAINKIIGIEKVRKDTKDVELDDVQPVEKRRPASRQVQDDDPVRVAKSGEGARMGVSFANIAFGKDGLAKM